MGMRRFAIILIISLLIPTLLLAAEKSPLVKFDTSMGSITIAINEKAAPKTAANFLQYVKDGYYDGLIFFRVIRGFMVQGGGLSSNMQKKETRSPISHEGDNGLQNLRGTVAMARTQAPHTATSQFFINTVDNHFLDHKSKTEQGWGYCVFAKVIDGMETVDKIESTPTGQKAGRRDVPLKPVVIRKVSIIK